MLEWLSGLHTAQGISQIVASGGLFVIIAIIFAETGLLVGFFLPGDSLLITVGVLANPANPNHVQTLDIILLNFILIFAAIIGDQLGYLLGKKTGDSIWKKPDGKLYKRRYLEEAHSFYEKFGGISVTAARYMPILRTFVPFVAGMARMPYKKFIVWNIVGGILWISSMLWLGYFLGQTRLADRLDKIIVVVLLVSFLPIFIGFLKKYRKGKKKSTSK